MTNLPSVQQKVFDMTHNPLCVCPPDPIVPTLTIAGKLVDGTYVNGSYTYMRWIFLLYPFSVMITASAEKINVVYRSPELGHHDFAPNSDLQFVADLITQKLDGCISDLVSWTKRVEALNASPDEKTTSIPPDLRAQEFLKRIRDEAAGMGLNIFTVVGGPCIKGWSIYHNLSNHDHFNAVWEARVHHSLWERENGFDPEHDWEREYDV
jgi:hypothetical protein